MERGRRNARHPRKSLNFPIHISVLFAEFQPPGNTVSPRGEGREGREPRGDGGGGGKTGQQPKKRSGPKSNTGLRERGKVAKEGKGESGQEFGVA
jgi:hypothetical protein